MQRFTKRLNWFPNGLDYLVQLVEYALPRSLFLLLSCWRVFDGGILIFETSQQEPVSSRRSKSNHKLRRRSRKCFNLWIPFSFAVTHVGETPAGPVGMFGGAGAMQPLIQSIESARTKSHEWLHTTLAPNLHLCRPGHHPRGGS